MNVHVRLAQPLIVPPHVCMDLPFLTLDVVMVVKFVTVLVHQHQSVNPFVHLVSQWARM